MQETCKEGQKVLSMLNPSMLFLVLVDLGFCTPACTNVNLVSKAWNLHTWASQVTLLN